MAARHPVSNRQVRRATGVALASLDQHAGALNEQRAAIQKLAPVAAKAAEILSRGFVGRLKWLLIGR